MHFLYICPFTNFSRDFSMHFLYICPSGNFHRDFQAYLFSICPQNTRKRARKRECSTHGNIPSFIYVFIFPVLSVHCCPHPPHDRPHYGLLIRSRTTMPHLRPTQQLLLQLRIMTFSNMKFSSWNSLKRSLISKSQKLFPHPASVCMP